MTDLTVEQRQAAADLDQRELVFANAWLNAGNNADASAKKTPVRKIERDNLKPV